MTDTNTSTPAVPEGLTVEKAMNFRYKKVEDKMGNVTQRQAQAFNFPVPSASGLADIVLRGTAENAPASAKKEIELVLDSMYDVMRSAVGERLSADDGESLNQENFPFSDFTWEKIANMPKEDRRANSIPAERYEAFFADYIAVMPGITGKDEEKVKNAVQVYAKKLSVCKTNKKILKGLKEQLELYLATAPNAENFSDILDFLINRADTYLKADDMQLVLENL